MEGGYLLFRMSKRVISVRKKSAQPHSTLQSRNQSRETATLGVSRRLRNSRTPCDDAHEPATAMSPRTPARQWDRPNPGTQRNRYRRPTFLKARAVAARSIVYLGSVG